MKKKPGRKPGYKHQEITKKKISNKMSGRIRTMKERDAISRGRIKAFNDPYKHYKDLLKLYPECKTWLDDNKELLKDMPNVLSEKELRNLKNKHISDEDYEM